jgi:hypothetical protein
MNGIASFNVRGKNGRSDTLLLLPDSDGRQVADRHACYNATGRAIGDRASYIPLQPFRLDQVATRWPLIRMPR